MVQQGRRHRALVLGGWSPGPLEVLQRQLREVEFWEPAIPMPPAGLRWCLNPFWALLVLYLLFGLPYMLAVADDWAGSAGAAWGLRAGILAGSCLVVRLLLALLVWFSIRDAMWVAAGALRSFEPDVLVGFSWGGGVACWLLAARRWAGPTVLLAPTVQAMARVQCAALPQLPGPGRAAPVHVFHARHDGFCPEAQARELAAAGCEVHWCDDDHVLCSRTSVLAIGRCLRQLLGEEASEPPWAPPGGGGPPPAAE